MRYPLNQIPPLRMAPKNVYPLIYATEVCLRWPVDVYTLVKNRRRTP